MNEINPTWGGRFQQAGDEQVKAFGASVHFDKRLAPYDIQCSIAHVTMLTEVGVLTAEEQQRIINGLKQIETEINDNRFAWSSALEDVHMNIEARLIELCGECGKKVHTGRSRNDQVATDMRLYLKAELNAISELLEKLMRAIAHIANDHLRTIMPGFTHLQNAQPITLAHHLLAYLEMLQRDHARLADCYRRADSLPLGAAALAGTSYPIDRARVAQLLGFKDICQNSLDAVSDRDFIIEFCAHASILMMHLSRFCEELILWSSAQFNYLEFSDAFCTGSSIMPQKKNPDVAELIRGKTARVYGSLIAVLTLMKAQPLAYNKDNQEDKEPLFDTVDTLKNVLSVFISMMGAMKFNVDALAQSAHLGFTTATDLADYLVKRGAAFRDAHLVVGKIVAYCIEHQCTLAQLSLETLTKFDQRIQSDVFEALSLDGSINSKNHLGGTAIAQIAHQLKRFL